MNTDVKEAAKKAIEHELGYYQDNVYRHIHFGKEKEDSEIVQYHRKKIRDLEQALSEL